MLSDYISNEIFLAVVIAAIITQSIKIIRNTLRERRHVLVSDFVVTGGMPSTHSALVSSLFMILLLENGMDGITVISFVLFLIVTTDALGVRRTAGEEAIALNKIISLEHLKMTKLKYALGHKPLEVFVGTLLGFATSFLIWYLI